jgi:hypothetical protein
MTFWDVEGSLKTVSDYSIPFFNERQYLIMARCTSSQSTIDDSDIKQQMNIVESGVNYNIKRYNDLRVLNERLTMTLKAKLDELDDQKSSYEDLHAMKNAQTEESMRIECLHRDTSIVERQIHEKTHYTRRLEHMLTRLKTNQVSTAEVHVAVAWIAAC